MMASRSSRGWRERRLRASNELDGAFLITLVVLDGRPVLRLTVNGKSVDYPLREGQVKLLLRQLIDWYTQ